MPLTKKIITWAVVAIILSVSFLAFTFGYLLPFIFGTHFTLTESYTVCDDNGFPGLSFSFSCSDTVTVKLIGPDSKLLDSDSFFKGEHETCFHLAEYRHSATPGSYTVRVYDKDNKNIYSQTLSFIGMSLSIISCDQKWWNSNALFGLRLNVKNNGDAPAYPYNINVVMDSDTVSGLALPMVILPGDSADVDCFIYKEGVPNNGQVVLSLEDIDRDTLATKVDTLDIENYVPTEQFDWNYKHVTHQVDIPDPEHLYGYYVGLDRIYYDDYSLYVFDPYDDEYIDMVTDIIMSGFLSTADIEKINYAASFVQSLPYKSDSDTNSSYEYPRYPIETLFTGNGGGDCEDKAILTASILKNMGYNVALLRFPNHMAVGVNISTSANPGYDYYINGYFFLETTTVGKKCGDVSSNYTDLVSEVLVYPVTSRPLLIHNWQNNNIIIYTNTDNGDLVKVTLTVENLGIETAENIVVEAGFYTFNDDRSNYNTVTISSLEPGMKKQVTLSVEIPKNLITWFKTRIYLDDKVVDEKESISSFP